MISEPIPVTIAASRGKQSVLVTWSDGHESIYPFELLRAGCPCASCRGGHENMSPEPDKEVWDRKIPDGPEIHMTGINPVGQYAVPFDWEDGHNSGIFSWYYLRALCPCDHCQKLRDPNK